LVPTGLEWTPVAVDWSSFVSYAVLRVGTFIKGVSENVRSLKAAL